MASKASQTMAEMSARPMIPSLTGLRFYAAGFIVFAHTVEYYFQSSTPPHLLNGSWRIANWGMTLFFVLSGFVIHYNYGEAVASYGRFELRSFLVARFARLYPLYILTLAIDLVLHGPSTFASPEFRHVWPYYLTLTQNWLPLHFDNKFVGETYMAGAWSISAELMLYIFYLILVRPLLLLRTPARVLAAIALLSISATVFQAGHAGQYWFSTVEARWWFYLSPLCRIPEFVLGALCAQLLIVQMKRRPQNTELICLKFLPVAALLWTMVLFTLSALDFSSYFADTFQASWGLAPPSAMLIYAFARSRNLLSFLVEHRLVILLGDASYSIYMLHGLMIWLLAHEKVPTGWFADFRILLTLILIAVISLGSYRYFEVPARRLIRTLLDPRATAIAPQDQESAGVNSSRRISAADIAATTSR